MNPELISLAREAAIAAVRELHSTPAIPCVWVDEVGAGQYLGVSARMLQDYRHSGTGPVWHKAGGRLVRYRLADLDAFMVAQTGAVE